MLPKACLFYLLKTISFCYTIYIATTFSSAAATHIEEVVFFFFFYFLNTFLAFGFIIIVVVFPSLTALTAIFPGLESYELGGGGAIKKRKRDKSGVFFPLYLYYMYVPAVRGVQVQSSIK